MKLTDKIRDLEEQGVHFFDKDKVEIRGELICGLGVRIETNVIFEGKVVLEDHITICSNVIMSNSQVDSGTTIKPFSLIENAQVGKECMVGPYARIRPGTIIGDDSQIGNFVEIKNSVLGTSCRVNHMAFIGDAFLADEVTIGAGTITCNHNGVKTNKTVIMKGAYIGSNVNLVAPVTIYEDSVIGSGSTITEDVPAKKLTVARVRQKVIESWKGFNK
jgi:bifunctional UDP-N-acetylglucosamine pyrophosphorylase/glucosamine-1-phosphate N-acetyltransferase